MANTSTFAPPDMEIIRKGSYKRHIYGGLRTFLQGRVDEEFREFYTQEELQSLQDAAVEKRMPVKNNPYYLHQALKSTPITNLIKPRPEETWDLSGEADPSSQNDYSPIPGLLHKYPEIVLLYAAPTCSAHCRYCYRLDLFTKTTGKEMIHLDAMIDYIRSYNDEVSKFNADIGFDPAQMKFPITEGLISGGDPMVLANTQLYALMAGLAEAGVSTVRIGTKELAFFPYRFDDDFFHMLETFHTHYPQVHLNFMVHFTHPDEFLEMRGQLRQNGVTRWIPEVEHTARNILARYHRHDNGTFVWREEIAAPVRRLLSYDFISLYNQTPVIHAVNDHAPALHVLQKSMHHMGVMNHYLFQCREIEGHRAFAVPVEEAYEIFRESQRGLSGTERTKYSMSTKWGKIEVVGRFSFEQADRAAGEYGLAGPLRSALHAMRETFGDRFIIFRIVRAPHDVRNYGRLIVARSNPKALWLSGYEDRIIYDGRKPPEEQATHFGTLLAGMLEHIGDGALDAALS